LVSLLDVYELLKNVKRIWAKVKSANANASAPNLFAT
jgi:hypothetical protein